MLGYIALGSNLGDREANLRSGLRGIALRGLPVRSVSSVWETEPVDSPEPLWFLNMVAEVDIDVSPRLALDRLHEVEREAGRVRSARNSPRVLDLDLLHIEGVRWNDSRLELPHPRMWSRRFVLAPLAEIAPRLRNPDTGRTVEETLRRLDGERVRKIGSLPRRGSPTYNRQPSGQELPEE